MGNYVIFTDSGCDINADVLKRWDVSCIQLFYYAENGDGVDTHKQSINEFYEQMRNGTVFRTSAANTETFRTFFEPELKVGNDILYLAFSSGLSNTSNLGQIAAKDLQERYPGRKVIVVDSLCASAGLGLLVYLTSEKKKAGATIEEAAQFAEKNKLNLCHWFTVNDLVYLKRGGRVSATAALVGAVLGIKPVLHVDDDGHLINMFKVRGRKKSIEALAKEFVELAFEPQNCTYFISNGDCPEDAAYLQTCIQEACGNKVSLIADIGPVIGSHSGPGTLAVFFLGRPR